MLIVQQALDLLLKLLALVIAGQWNHRDLLNRTATLEALRPLTVDAMFGAAGDVDHVAHFASQARARARNGADFRNQ